MIERTYSKEDGQHLVTFAREALETYAKEGQQMDVGSVSDLLNSRGGVFVKIRSTVGRKRARGRSGVYNGQKLARSLITAVTDAASSRSVGDRVSRNELRTVRLKIAPIERIAITNTPAEDITIGQTCPVITQATDGWMYPMFPREQEWSPEVYLQRVCRKCDLSPDAWENAPTAIAKTRPFIERKPGVGVPEDETTSQNSGFPM